MDETQVWLHTDLGRANWPRVDRLKMKAAMIDQGWIDTRKGRYDDKCAKVDTRVICTKAVRGTIDGEKYFERLILRSVKQLISFENQNVGSD